MNGNRLRILVVLNASWNIFNFRLGLMRMLREDGHEILAAAPRDAYSNRIPFLYHDLPMSTRSTNPFIDAGLLWRLLRLYRKLKPNLVLHFTPKPNIYGSLAAACMGIPVISNIAGLGAAFSGKPWLRRCLETLYRVSLRRNHRVFFQNQEDMRYFLEKAIVRRDQAVRIPGSGIDLQKFRPVEPEKDGGDFCFLLVSRMLWEKGIGDFVGAAEILKGRGVEARFQLLGFLGEGNPAVVDRRQMDVWVGKGWVEYLSESDDVRREISQADCIVLPSRYREGVPRTLLEAAAMSKPIIAYDNVGVRDVVESGGNGILVPMGDIQALADAMESMTKMDSGELQAMGAKGREKVELEFDELLIASAYREAISGILPKNGT